MGIRNGTGLILQRLKDDHRFANISTSMSHDGSSLRMLNCIADVLIGKDEDEIVANLEKASLACSTYHFDCLEEHIKRLLDEEIPGNTSANNLSALLDPYRVHMVSGKFGRCPVSGKRGLVDGMASCPMMVTRTTSGSLTTA